MAAVLTHSKLTSLYHSSAIDNKPGNQQMTRKSSLC